MGNNLTEIAQASGGELSYLNMSNLKTKEYKKRWYQKYREEIKKKNNIHYHEKYKKYIAEHPEIYKPRWKEKNRKKGIKWQKFLFELKLKHGGKCTRCEYDSEPRILQFHHLYNKFKEVSVIKNRKKATEEAQKCILLCPNCHAIIHLKAQHKS